MIVPHSIQSWANSMSSLMIGAESMAKLKPGSIRHSGSGSVHRRLSMRHENGLSSLSTLHLWRSSAQLCLEQLHLQASQKVTAESS